jgi:tRNA-specific 2-thiouridylase
MKKSIALFSGGLDSALAVKLMQNQNIAVLAVFVDIGFESGKNKLESIKRSAALLQAEFLALDLRRQFIENILFNPKYGYGRNFNPCIDCHAFMIKEALSLLPKYQADFVITGEVINERPMSQTREALGRISELVEDNGLVLRPLSAKLMPETLPEKRKWVERDKLLGISGRSRQQQLSLAKKYGIKHYSSPAGGCLLTDVGFCKKLKNFIADNDLRPEHIPIIKAGRHFKLLHGSTLILARDESECKILTGYSGPDFIKIGPKEEISGPTALLSAQAAEPDQQLAYRIIVSYSKEKCMDLVVNNAKLVKANAFSGREEIKKYAL